MRWFDRLGIGLVYVMLVVAALLVTFVIWQVLL